PETKAALRPDSPPPWPRYPSARRDLSSRSVDTPPCLAAQTHTSAAELCEGWWHFPTAETLPCRGQRCWFLLEFRDPTAVEQHTNLVASAHTHHFGSTGNASKI